MTATNWAEIEKQVYDARFTVGTEATNVINVAIQLLDRDGDDLNFSAGVPFYLSSAADGSAIGTAPSGGIAIGTDGLAIEWTANVAGMLVSEADGDIDLDMTEVGALTNYLVLVMPNGQLKISGAITHAA